MWELKLLRASVIGSGSGDGSGNGSGWTGQNFGKGSVTFSVSKMFLKLNDSDKP